MEMEALAKRKYTNWDEVPIILSTQEAADALGVHINTIKRLVADGELAHFFIGRVWKFRKGDIMRFAGITPPEDDT